MIAGSLLAFLTEPVPETPGHYIYRVAKQDDTLYIGRSLQPAVRLREHVTISGLNEIGTLGKVIYCNLPNSLLWQVKLYTLLDCQKIVAAYYMSDVYGDPLDIREEKLDDYQLFAYADPNEQYYNFFQHHTGFLSDAEAALIWRYRPCVNVVFNDERPAYPPTVQTPQDYFVRFPDTIKARLFLKQQVAKVKEALKKDQKQV